MREYKKPEKLKAKKVKCSCGHQTDFKVAGHYESVILFCESCNTTLVLTKKEVDNLA